MNPCIKSQLICTRDAKYIQRGKDSPFNKWHWENWTVTCNRMKLDSYVTQNTKINSKLLVKLKELVNVVLTLSHNHTEITTKLRLLRTS